MNYSYREISKHHVIGVDIGGSHITAGIVELTSRRVIKESLLREHVDSKSSAGEIISAWVEVIVKSFNAHPECEKKIGIAMPGPFDYEEGVSKIKGVDKFECLFGLNVKQILSEKLRVKKSDIAMMNDAGCFLKGEVFSGAAIGCKNVVGVTLGTGLGSASFHNGNIYEGHLYSSPFKEGTAEDYLSTRWFVKRYREITGNTISSVKELRSRIAEDPRAASLFAEFGKNLGNVLAAYVQKHDCEMVIVGGNIMNAWELFYDETKKTLDSLPKPVMIKKAELGEESALIGAASVWL